MSYNPGQFNTIIPFVQKEPDWLILGGPADGDEAQCAVKKWPKLKVVGIEPVAANREWQLANGWPGDLLYPNALSDILDTKVMHQPLDNTRTASFLDNRPGPLVAVNTITLDLIEAQIGPFKNAILWMDIEGWEYQALLGGNTLLSSRGVQLINVEVLERLTEEAGLIQKLLTSYGYELVHTWNVQPGLCCDQVYRRKTGCL